jgi:hypothetical protein
MPEPFGKPCADQVALAAEFRQDKTLSWRLASLLFPVAKKLPQSWTNVRTTMKYYLNLD